MTRRTALVVGTLLGGVALAALHSWRGIEYWNYSEGVYAYTARQFLEGGDLYGDIFVAQPPWQFFFGAMALAFDDSLSSLRLAVGFVQLAGGVVAAVAVWRLTTNPWATAAAPVLSFVTPWAMREHGALTPELLAPVVLLGAALLASRPRTAAWAGALAAVAIFLKWPFGLAVIAIVLFSAAPKRAAIGMAVAVAVQAVVFTAVLGPGLWSDSVLAQMGSDLRGPDLLKGLWGQGFWSLIGLVVVAGLAWRRRAALHDAALVRVLAALAVAMLVTLITNVKDGTALNIIVPIEAVLVPLVLAGATVPASRALVAAALVFTLAQSASLLAEPDETRAPFLYPGSERTAWGRTDDTAAVNTKVAAARACPDGVPYSGPAFLAFLARRPMPADQPDQFLPQRSPRLADVQRRIEADQTRCG